MAMINVAHAISVARSYLETVFSVEGYRDIRLEEVVLSEDDKFWLITFGFEREELGGTYWKRDYKVVKVDAESGQARGILIREMA